WITRKLGVMGGLKAVEKRFGLARQQEIEDLTGHDAPILWAKYLRGDKTALEQLIQYNAEDVVHLKAIMEIAYDKLCENTTTYWKNTIAPVFHGMAAIPKTRTSTVLRSLPTPSPTESPVSRMLEKLRSQGTSPRIVGIDLTGSAKRATGWALMDGANATTQSLKSDEELIAATIAQKPDLVSIDSPLSLPEGYGRRDVPIYRKCELALKRMGISVFWCLLPSMEMLTHRGIRLANEFRKQGFKVIESYPGAAQDILGIP